MKTKKKTATAAAKPAAAKSSSLGVADLAKHLKIEPATARLKLREAKVKKTGKSYAWTTQAEMKKVADKLVA